MKRTDKIQWVYNSQNNQELAQRYNQWAKDYEQDLTETFGRPDREPIVDLTIKYVAKDGRILDAGAGTGLLGQWLYNEGYRHLVGIDLSEGMLSEADNKQVYTKLRFMMLGEALDFPAATFDAVTACGVFTYGHAPSSSFDELIRITKPGGYLMFTLRPDFYESSDFKDKMTSLHTQGKWRLIERGEKYLAEPEGEPDLFLETWVYQVCSN